MLYHPLWQFWTASHMSRRSFLCLAAACCCVVLLERPVHGGRVGPTGLVAASSNHQLSSESQFHDPHQVADAQPKERQRGATMKAARPLWSSSSPAAGRVRAELRSVPGGPDPMHHHGSPRRPEQEDHGAAP
ncbi:hypothetical protein QOZ80_9BG0708980 [Eleusine coracana subsp. coracana]|nr:hypothetical protein QOZ80_9BG0708980 [Eleusine coracana subsp. coracana]